MRDAAELPTGGDADIAALASLLADPARCKVLLALDDGRALPPVSWPTKRVSAGRRPAATSASSPTPDCCTVETHGRHRYYRLAGPEVGELLEQLGRLAPPRPVRSLREGTRAARLRSARTCYDHVAGRLGVAVMGSLLDREALVGGDGRYDPRRDSQDALSSPGHDLRYELTDAGRDFLTGIGVEMPTGKRPLVRYCVDWTEQRHHLSGGLGRAVFDRFLSAGWVKRVPRGRALTVTDDGRTALADAFGIDWSA